MDESAEDLIKYFKSKVEDAISLLPQIPETQHDEVWTYWQVISVAVKAAVGGRGPIVAKRTKAGTARGRPRGRPRLYNHQREVLTGNGGNNLTAREETGERVTKATSGKCSNEKCDTVDSKKGLEQLSVIKPTSPQDGTSAITDANCTEESFYQEIPTGSREQQHPHVPTTVAAPASSEISTMTVEHVSADTLGDQEIVVKISREEGSNSGPQVHLVSEPKRTLAGASSQATVEITTAMTSNISKVVVTSAAATISGPVPQSSEPCLAPSPVIKRKRGRPPKSMSVKSLQTLPACASVQPHQREVVPSVSSEVGPEGKIAGGSELSSAGSSAGDGKLQNGLQSIITALELEERKSKSTTMAVAGPASTVRRSERRVAPNRDKLFCYFDQTQREEEEEGVEDNEERSGSTTAISIAEKLVAEVKQESKDVKVKSEDEKMGERTCHVCSAILMSASSMAAHMRIHTGERPFACPVCHKTFTTKGNCERHEVTHVGLKAFTCTECHKKFTEKKSLKIHMRSHTGERPYACSVCGMRFFQTGTLKTHMDRHTGRKRHLCELCGKAFRQGCQLRVHMRRHNKDMAFSCQHCSKCFYTKSDMERHELKHTGERPFSCDQCSETFTRLQYLREHQNTHLGRRPYKCVICGLSFHDFKSCHRHVSKHQVLGEEQPAQQIHVEVAPDTPTQQVMEHVQLILDQQNLSGYQAAEIQTLIIPNQPSNATSSSTTAMTTATATTSQQTAQAILSNILNAEGPAEVYHVTLVDSEQDVAVSTDNSTVQTVSAADFSAINLLASATTQLSSPK